MTEHYAGYHQFRDRYGNLFGSFEVFWKEHTDSSGEFGWYWQACFPGCLPDGEPTGPFDNAVDAYNDANNIE